MPKKYTMLVKKKKLKKFNAKNIYNDGKKKKIFLLFQFKIFK